MTDLIIVKQHGRVGLITLDRPKALNALNAQLTEELIAAATAFDRDREVGAIIVTGSARAFAAGADIAELEGKSYDEMTLTDGLADWDAFAAIRTPTIAAVAGFALGGGCEVAMMCDIILAADNARFGLPEIKLGVIPGMGGTQRLTHAIGKAKAMELILTGKTLSADDAERAGLVTRVVPAESLRIEALKLAGTIAEMSLPVVYAAKEAVGNAFELSLADGIRSERRAFHSMFALDDQSEGMGAYREKRAPVFGHR